MDRFKLIRLVRHPRDVYCVVDNHILPGTVVISFEGVSQEYCEHVVDVLNDDRVLNADPPK